MPQITITFDLNHETVAEAATALSALCNELNKKTEAATPTEQATKPAKPVKPSKPTKPKEPPAEDPEPEPGEDGVAEISMTDVRAAALKLSKAGKQPELKEIFAKYGADKLSDISEDDYPELMADLRALNG